MGDIVSVLDEDDGEAYYAQIRGFLQDQYMEVSAVVTWLLPTSASPPHTFDPATFIHGKFVPEASLSFTGHFFFHLSPANH